MQNILAITTFLFATIGFAAPRSFSDAKKGQLAHAEVEDLRPTQSSVGFVEVERKAKELEKMSKEERRYFLEKNPIPVVVGPGGEIYPIDHHHLARAVLEAGHKKIYVKIIENLSAYSEARFWQWMIEKRYLDLVDSRGHEIKISDLPRSISDMTDDPFRSLAGGVLREGGYTKEMTPFAEFQWALFFRKYFSAKDLKNHYKKVLKKATELALSPAARDLPGAKGAGAGSCDSSLL